MTASNRARKLSSSSGVVTLRNPSCMKATKFASTCWRACAYAARAQIMRIKGRSRAKLALSATGSSVPRCRSA